MADLVAYVAYGSNLDPARFDCYVAGGQPQGATRRYLGCRDRTPPRAVVGVRIPHRLYFAGYSSIWGGAAAFLDGNSGDGATSLGVAYLVTREQFADIVAQENGGQAGSFSGLGRLPAPGHSVRIDTPGWYDTVLGLAPVLDAPAVTFTTSDHLEPGPPSRSYLDTIVSGLREHHGLCVSCAERYLAGNLAGACEGSGGGSCAGRL